MSVTATIADNNLKLDAKSWYGHVTASGTVAPDGSFTAKLDQYANFPAGTYEITGRFSGDRFSGAYRSTDCKTDREVSLKRVR